MFKRNKIYHGPYESYNKDPLYINIYLIDIPF